MPPRAAATRRWASAGSAISASRSSRADRLWRRAAARLAGHAAGGDTMSYRAPVADISFTLKHAAGLGQVLEEGLYGELAEDVVDAVLEEAGRFATDVIGPLNQVGDRLGTPLKDGVVTMPPGWKEAYSAWTAAGWNGLAAPA